MNNSIKKTKMFLRTAISLLIISLFSSFAIPAPAKGGSAFGGKALLHSFGYRRAQAINYILSPRWASQSPDLKQKVLKALGETVKKYPKKTKHAATILNCYLDFDRCDLEQVRLNIDVLNMLSELPDEFKTLEIVLNAVDFIKYEGEQKENLRKAGLKFFRAISRELMFKKCVKNNNNKRAFPKDGNKNYYNEIGKYSLLTHIGEVKLGVLKLISENEIERNDARESLITSNLRLPFDTIKRFFSWSDIDTMRLVAEGNLGLIRAADKYKPSSKKKFSTYAVFWIKQFIKRFITRQKEELYVPVHVYQEMRTLCNTCEMLGVDILNTKNSDETVSSVTGIPTKKVSILRKKIAYRYVVLDDDSAGGNETCLSNGDLIGDPKIDPNEMTNKMMAESGKILLKELCVRIEQRIIRSKTEKNKDVLITILWKRFFHKVRGTEREETLEKIGLRHNITRERVRQIEQRLIKDVKKYANTSEEQMIIDNLVTFGYEKHKNSFAEFFMKIYKEFSFDAFCTDQISLIQKECSANIRNVMLGKLCQFSLLKRVKKGVYKISSIFQGNTNEETEENIIGVCRLKLHTTGKVRRTKSIMEQYNCQSDKIVAIRECIKMDLTHRLLKRMIAEAGIHKEPCTIRLWKGYTCGVQEDLPQCIRNAMKNGPYKIEFFELNEFEKLEHNNHSRGNGITILPFDRLSEPQKQTLGTTKAWFINMDFEKPILDPYAFVQLEAIIASGVAYLNNDDFTFNNLYKMLTESTDDIKVSIEKLKENPTLAIEYIFTLKPGKVHIDDLAPLNKRMKKLVDSAA